MQIVWKTCIYWYFCVQFFWMWAPKIQSRILLKKECKFLFFNLCVCVCVWRGGWGSGRIQISFKRGIILFLFTYRTSLIFKKLFIPTPPALYIVFYVRRTGSPFSSQCAVMHVLKKNFKVFFLFYIYLYLPLREYYLTMFLAVRG